MSLNKYMHPRNRYKNAKPSFLQLALKYPDFRAMTTQDESGKVFLDFKNADALRALTRCLLKEDFGLTVELPTDRLVPTLPLRLNYIHWLEDIIGTDHGKWGIDIGTGASCIYPLLGGKMNQWNFLATEKDAENLYHAQKNVTDIGLSHLIQVKNVPGESILMSAVESFPGTDTFDFCMCNPPFFADHMEAQGLTTTRSDDRPEAGSVSTASPQECIVAGGEIAFVRQMIEESTVLRGKIRVYTSMLGKKTSLAQLKEELRHQKVAKYSTTEFCQGKTMRWGIAWTYDTSITFPRSQFETRKAKPPLQYVIPKGSKGEVEYRVHDLARHLRQLLESIKVHCYQGKQAKSYTSITLTAAENTWCHQRRLRRQQQRKSSGSAADSQTQDDKDNGEVKSESPIATKDSGLARSDGEADKHPTTDNKNESSANSGVEKESESNSEELDGRVTMKTTHKRQLSDPLEMVNTAVKKIRSDNPEGELGVGEDVKESTVKSESVKVITASSHNGIAGPPKKLSNFGIANSPPVHNETSKCVEATSTEKPNSSMDWQQCKKTSPALTDEESRGCRNVEAVSSEAAETVPTEAAETVPIEAAGKVPTEAVETVLTEEVKTERIETGETVLTEAATGKVPTKAVETVSNEAAASSSTEELGQPKQYVLKCVMRLKRAGENINLELEWLDGQSRELMHQVFTFLKNKLAQI